MKAALHTGRKEREQTGVMMMKKIKIPRGVMLLLIVSLAIGGKRALSVSSGDASISSGGLTFQWIDSGRYQLTILQDSETNATVFGAPLTIRRGQHVYGYGNGLDCGNQGPVVVRGHDAFGPYTGLDLNCTLPQANNIRVDYVVRAYETEKEERESIPVEGMLRFALILPSGLSNISVTPVNINNMQPPQFAPFPAWQIAADGGTAFNSNLTLCYGGDKAQIMSLENGVLSLDRCGGLAGGPVFVAWPTNDGTRVGHTLVASAADSFHLNFNKREDAEQVGVAVLWRNDDRDDMVFCASQQCNSTQSASKYHVYSLEGIAPQTIDGTEPLVPLFFWWNPDNQDNWVTNSSTPPGPGYDQAHAADAFLYARSGPARKPVLSFVSPSGKKHIATSSEKGIAFAKKGNYSLLYTLGYIEEGSSVPTPNSSWTFGVSGEVDSVPAGFSQSSLFYLSSGGINAAVDEWGSRLRAAYNTTKKENEDIFLQALTLWTDNGAATLGVAWQARAGTPAPKYPGPGSFNVLNWTMVDEEHLGTVADQVTKAGVAPRAIQLDCWWYPRINAAFWCASDWVLPEEFYPKGFAGLRERTRVPLMLYLPAVCPSNIWQDRYNWTSTNASGFLLPDVEDAQRFFNDIFSQAAQQAKPPSQDPWPGVWAPSAVKQGWTGTNLASYETDFVWNMFAKTPEFRSQYGANERFMQAMENAAASNNMTVQLCAGNPPEMFKSLTMPSITQARASIDYDWDTGDSTIKGQHNWAAADNAWVFWATRTGLSKDNFWSSYRDLLPLNYHADSPFNGMNAELHAVAAVMSAGVVGIGDWVDMVNGTLIQRLARQDGITLRPDRPLAPMDVMFASLLGLGRALPGYQQGARLWSTHAAIAPEDTKSAPELAKNPTRRLTSHAGVAATMQASVPTALAELPSSTLQWFIVGVNNKPGLTLTAADLYPPPESSSTLLYRSYHWPACRNGTDPIKTGCLKAASGQDKQLMDVSTAPAPCQDNNSTLCPHELSVWQVFEVTSDASAVVLGDLSSYVSGSGYRFRYPSKEEASDQQQRQHGGSLNGQQLIVVGSPGETVNVSYLVYSPSGDGSWEYRTKPCSVGPSGRTVVSLE